MNYFKIVENDYIIAAGFGDYGEEIDYSEFVKIKSLFLEKPAKIGYDYKLKADTYTWDEIERDKSTLTDDELKELYKDEIISSVTIHEKPTADKAGYHLVQRYDSGSNCILWEYVKDESANVGTYTNPIPYEVGMEVNKYTDDDAFSGDGWYSFDGDVKVCIKSGTPTSFDDAEYFAYFV